MASVILSCVLFDVKTVYLYKVLSVYNGYKMWLLPITKSRRFPFYNSNLYRYLKHTLMSIVNIAQIKYFKAISNQLSYLLADFHPHILSYSDEKS